MRILTANQIKQVEERAFKSGFTEEGLMKCAGTAFFNKIIKQHYISEAVFIFFIRFKILIKHENETFEQSFDLFPKFLKECFNFINSEYFEKVLNGENI